MTFATAPGAAFASLAAVSLTLACHSPSAAPTPVVAPEAPANERTFPAPEPAPLPSYDAVRPSAAILAPDFPAREPRRAWLAEAGPLYWSLDDAREGRAASQGDGSRVGRRRGTVVVAERHADHLRVRWHGDGLLATFYTPVSDFEELTAKATTLTTVGGAPFSNGCGVSVPPGTHLDLGASAGDHRSATFERPWMRAEGAVPDEAIDRIYRIVEVEPPPTDVAVVGPLMLRDGPRGKVVAELKDDTLSCRRQGAPTQGHQLLACHRDDIRIVGYAPQATITDHGLGRIRTTGSGSGGGWAMTHTSFLYLWPGDRLSAPGGSEPVAVVEERRLRVVDRGSAPDGSHEVGAYLHPWDFLTLRMALATHRRATERHEAWLSRISYERLTTEPAAATEEMRITLRWLQRGVARCYDRFLERTPATAVTYDVSLVVDDDPPDPILTPKGKPQPQLEVCLQHALRSRRRIVYGTAARFRLHLAPNPGVDPPTEDEAVRGPVDRPQ